MRKLTKNYKYLEILVPYLNNPSEEAIFGSHKIRSNMKEWNFKMRKLCSKTFKILSKELNRPGSIHKWETSQKKARVLQYT